MKPYLKDLERSRNALQAEYPGAESAPASDALVRAAASKLTQILERGPTADHTEVSLLVIILDQLGQLYPEHGNKALSDLVYRYLDNHPKLQCKRQRVWYLRDKYQLVASPTEAPVESSPSVATEPTDQPDPLPFKIGFHNRAGVDALAQLAEERAATVILVGPKGFGKSYWLKRYANMCAATGKHVIPIDLNAFDRVELEDYKRFLDTLTGELALSLGVDTYAENTVTSQLKMTMFIGKHIRDFTDRPVVLLLDNIDRVGDRDFRDDFLAMLRAWHNKRSFVRRNSAWPRTGLVLATTADPADMITDPMRSPFTVGTTVELRPLSLNECGEFVRAQEVRLTEDQLANLHQYTGGHPTLVASAVHWLLDDGRTLDQLKASASDQTRGPFARHLGWCRLWFSKHEKARKAFYQLLDRKETQPDPATADQLCRAGLVVREQRGRVRPCSRLHAEVFR